MKIIIKNCNNIKEGTITIEENIVNIKYGFNGTGKSTIAKAIQYQFEAKPLDFFKPFHCGSDEESTVEILPSTIHKVAIFNEEYINSYIFKPNELIANSFEIFVKNQAYEENLERIDVLTKDIKTEFNDNEGLSTLITVLDEFIQSFGKAASKIAASGSLAKGLGNGNPVENIPKDLAGYSPFIQQKENVKYIGWQANGIDFLSITDACPFCAQHLDEEGDFSKATVKKVSERYNSNNIKHLNAVMEIFEKLSDYFSDMTKSRIDSFCKQSGKIDEQSTKYLLEIKEQATNFRDSLDKLKNLGFRQLKDVDDIVVTLSSLPIKMEFLSHFNGSSLTCSIVEEINQRLLALQDNAKRLLALINMQKLKISETIKLHETEINTFLSNAGFKYSVRIEGDDQEKILLYPLDGTKEIENVSAHLSYGEKNSLALVLFAFQANHDGADFIILDDPISSFDGNKKFATIQLLFMKDEKHSCKFVNRTVLLLTHDFSSVINMEHILHRKLSCRVKSMYLYCDNRGILSEKLIQKNDIISCITATKKIMSSDKFHLACRLSALRRYTELFEGKNDQWNYLSSILHREEPGLISGDNRREPFSEDKLIEIEYNIGEYIKDYSHTDTVQSFQDKRSLIRAYEESTNTYEKLQIFRVIQGNDGTDNNLINKFINETFHIENDYLFQLDPFEYELVPDYIVDRCNQIVSS